jgi:hypothetical protein
MIQKMLAACLLGVTVAAAPISATADKDTVQFFEDIRVAPGAWVHNAVCFFCTVEVEGEARGNVVVVFGNVHIAGKADKNVVDFFGKVSAADKAQIGSSLVSLFGMTRLGEDVSVGKDMVVIFGVLRAPETAIMKTTGSRCRL